MVSALNQALPMPHSDITAWVTQREKALKSTSMLNTSGKRGSLLFE
jgi:hypothetical protein